MSGQLILILAICIPIAVLLLWWVGSFIRFYIRETRKDRAFAAIEGFRQEELDRAARYRDQTVERLQYLASLRKDRPAAQGGDVIKGDWS